MTFCDTHSIKTLMKKAQCLVFGGTPYISLRDPVQLGIKLESIKLFIFLTGAVKIALLASSFWSMGYKQMVPFLSLHNNKFTN